MNAKASLARLRRELNAASRPHRVPGLSGFFKTGPGEYGEGDVFIGVSVPEMRRIASFGDGLEPEDVVPLLHSRIHEERMVALMVWVRTYQRGDDRRRARVFRIYLPGKKVDQQLGSGGCVGLSYCRCTFVGRPRGQLDRMARSPHLWTRRIAVVSTYAFIRCGDTKDIFRLSAMLLGDSHDLMHKACGWMLREAGKRDPAGLRKFLRTHAPRMPRTMLRYSIEKFSPAERKRWLEQSRQKKVTKL